MIRSLRTRLALCVFACITLVLAGSGFALYEVLRDRLLEQFDESLLIEARTLTGMIENDRGRVDFEWEDSESLTAHGPNALPDFFQVRGEDGESLSKSEQMPDEFDLPRFFGSFDKPAFQDLTLPNGRFGRAIGVSFKPKADLADEDSADLFEMPEAVRKAAEAAVPGIALDPQTESGLEDDELVYEVKGSVGDKRYELDITSKGRVIEVDEDNEPPALDPEDQEEFAIELVIARDTSSLIATLASLRNLLLGVWALATIASIAPTLLAITRGLAPLRELSNQIETKSEHELDKMFQLENAPSELTPVVDHLNELIDRLAAAFKRERAFTSNAAHELRTPLAGLRTTLEVALSRERGSEEYRQAAEQCLDICEQMHPLIENMLVLSRAESGRIVKTIETVSPADCFPEWWEPFAETASKKSVQIKWDTPSDITVETDNAMLRMVMTNLFENASNYVDEQGVIATSIARDNGLVRICVSNTSRAINEDDASRVFDPFWRSDSARSATGVHAGLGLALCKRIVKVLGGSIEATVENDRFSINASISANGNGAKS